MFQYFIYKIFLFVIHVVPRAWSYRIADVLAGVHFRHCVKDRQAVVNNLRQITGSAGDLEPQARRVFVNFGRYLVDFFLMYKTVTREFIARHVTVEGFEHFTRANALGRGVILLTAHVGNWEKAAAVMCRMGHPLTVIALPHKNPKVNELFNRQRETYGMTVVPTNTAVRRCVEALRKGHCIALLGDRDFGSFGEPMLFFGRKTLIPKGAAFFACRTGAPIVPSFFTPRNDGHYNISFREPIFPPENVAKEDQQAVMAGLMEQYVAAIEDQIRQDPTQWLIFREFGIEFQHLYPDPRA
jgi:Kdo2-lipid IVA lauroyltransferase/acyltransferase